MHCADFLLFVSMYANRRKHVKAARISFELAKKYGGGCNLRMDDTNPEKESEHYVEGIKEMVRWLGFEWAGEVKYASD